MKRKQLSFDIDTKVAKAILGKNNYVKAYMDVRNFLEQEGWEHIEGSVYMSVKPMSSTRVAKTLDHMIEMYPYLTKCFRSMHQTDVPERIYSMNWQFDYDGTPGRFAKPEPEHKMKPKHRSR